jgi:hypothetical protein
METLQRDYRNDNAEQLYELFTLTKSTGSAHD